MRLVALEDDRLDDRIEGPRGHADDPGTREERALEDLLAAGLEAIARHYESRGRRRATHGIQVSLVGEDDHVRAVKVVSHVCDP